MTVTEDDHGLYDARTVRVMLAEWGSDRIAEGFTQFASRFGTEGSVVRIHSPRPQFKRN